ncbi:site-2 protease family protein [Botrimarina mediterranea]|uniref:Regulator of sigma-E protease RseP n=1 Tax=Botrimarina mediterranea TaxID=2528022 RepID=A0A518K2G7_9BACT|nr:site-2 protease family protein [Botrimarina mediterranea]QDV71994.1 Regulator of sigma-E protease RseP [Botrimarina mediterranea]QDV76535.1 Regulator of sigma-E protease RseP [Planctomycetes bacterium K2D]
MQTLFAILQVALGLGFVIFVHELGHFLVAKACGVRCDKFMIGFDIGGLKLSRKWGETEYGIGILPLGGYVKMFGQEDNAGAIAEEIEASKAMEGSPDAKEVMGPDGKKVWVHKRSYMAKSVPQRMAIISAGVIMNVIFAVVMAFIAFGVGVPETPATVGATIAGSPAWQVGLRTGDRLTRIGDIQNPTHKQLVGSVVLGDLEKGLDTEVLRTDGSTEQITLRPKLTGMAPQVGVLMANRLRLSATEPVAPHSPAASLGDEGFEAGDQIVAVDGEEVDTYAGLFATFAAKRDQPLTLTVIRDGKAPAGDPFGVVEGGERVDVTLPPDPMERLGIVPTLGPVVVVEQGSPADEAGIKVGDVITAVDGEAIGAAPEGEPALDPVTLDAKLGAIAARREDVVLTVDRNGEAVELSMAPRVVTWQSMAITENSPQTFDAIGAACELRAEVASLIGGSPAAASDLRPGDRVSKATLSWTDAKGVSQTDSMEFGEGQQNWPVFILALQNPGDDFTVELSIASDSSAEQQPSRSVKLKPVSVSDSYMVNNRGLVLSPLRVMHVAKNFQEQAELAFRETGSALMSVVRFLQKIGGQVSVKALGGPLTIAQVAGEAAFEGVGALLMSLVMLSANLAVLNFLPIPVLDGGHMVFLLYEGITGRPVNEKVAIALQTVGLLLLLSLMLFVTSMDISRLVTSLF